MGLVVLRDRSTPTRFPDNILHLVCAVRGSGCAVHRGLKKGGREPWAFLYALFLSLFLVKGVSDFLRYSNGHPAIRTAQTPLCCPRWKFLNGQSLKHQLNTSRFVL